MTANRPYYARIDAVRALGAFAVAAYHISGWTVHGTPLLPASLRAWVPAHAALMVFFVISGFLLRLALDRGPADKLAASVKFALGRVFRMLPIVIAATLLIVLIPQCQVGGTPVREMSFLMILKNALLLDVTLNGTWWALQVEMLMIPVLLYLHWVSKRFGERALMVIAVVATGLAFVPGWTGWPPLSANLFAFALGMLVPSQGRKLAKQVPLAVFIPLLFTAPIFGTYSVFATLIEGWIAYLLVCRICYPPTENQSRILDAKWLQAIGMAAGSYYVLHMATLLPMTALAAMLVPAEAMSPATGGLIVAVWLALMVPISWLGYRGIEVPGIKAGKRLSESRLIRALHLPAWSPRWPALRVRQPR